jgi:hypothetical protein
MATDTQGLLQALVDGNVEFVLIGGVAGQLLGSPIVTYDLDVCHARDDANLERLAVVLAELHAELRGAPSGLPFRLDAQTLRNGDSFTFSTTLGDLDILATPAGTRGFDDLVTSADRYEIDGLSIRVASLDDLIRMKRAAGRTKDLLALEELGALRDELDRGGGGR